MNADDRTRADVLAVLADDIRDVAADLADTAEAYARGQAHAEDVARTADLLAGLLANASARRPALLNRPRRRWTCA